MSSLREHRSQIANGLSDIKGSAPVANDNNVAGNLWETMNVQTMKTRELRAALLARSLDAKGPKRVLQARLQQSIHEEKEEELEYLAMVEASKRAEAALEESGSVYTVGLNRRGQLGLSDAEDRSKFTVVKSLRGKGIIKVCTGGGDCVIALSNQGNVYTWGGVGNLAATRPNMIMQSPRNKKKGRSLKPDSSNSVSIPNPSNAPAEPVNGVTVPMLAESLQGEGIIDVGCSPNHFGAISDGGDLYLWGDGTRGQLGTGDFENRDNPCLVDSLQESSGVKSIALGQTHTLSLGEENQDFYAWGFSSSGKLGIGVAERRGVKPPYNKYFPSPTKIASLSKVIIRLISCSANHSAAVTDEGVYTWGSGDGGRLGHGDHRDRLEPTKVEALSGMIILDVSLGFWHSSAIVQVPPFYNGGWLYTWGSGYHGQLAQGDVTCSIVPTLSKVSLDMHLLFVKITNGPTHSVSMSVDGDLYSWGSNTHGELGREFKYDEEIEKQYSSIPGFVPGFDSMVDGIGRGAVISFACGKSFTVVCTCQYTGESMEEKQRRLEEDEDDEDDEDE